MLSNWEMEQASGQVRQIAMDMTRAMQELDQPTTWSGDDADRFMHQWNDLVYSRLIAAANKLDGLSFTELTDAWNG
jgi:hypothetical protein